ncbi:MAG TPA: MATE family efflux transporter [Firmicutes bacterium]|nr:MATE family efflux transporter [Candidatus Fermentithermobacillaceae bacterium]
MTDLTTGNEAKLLFMFSLPMLLGNVFQQLYNTVDSMIVGRHLGKESLAAVGASFPIMFLLVALTMGISMGATILIAQYYGAKDMSRVKKTIDTTFIFLAFASLAVTFIGLTLSGRILNFLKVPADVLPQAQTYLNIILLGSIVSFGYNTISAILRGLGDSRTPLYFLILATIVNIALDLLFIIYFNWGVAGAAWATVVAQSVSFVTALAYLKSKFDIFRIDIRSMQFDKEVLGLSVRIGLPSGVQQTLVSIGMLSLQSLVNGFGKDVLAAYTVAGRIDSFASMPAMNLSAALSAFTGQNLGANRPDRVRKGYHAALIMACAISLLFSITALIFKQSLIAVFNTDPQVLAIGGRYLSIVSFFYIPFAAMFVTNGVLRGAGATTTTMVFTLISQLIVRVPAAYVFSKRLMSPDGIWWAMPTGWIVGLALSTCYYLTGKWKEKVVVTHELQIQEE